MAPEKVKGEKGQERIERRMRYKNLKGGKAAKKGST